MYFQFDRQRVGTIRGQWVRSIFRIDHRMETLSDVNARYGDAIAEASYYSTRGSRILGGRLSPIIVATILFSLGWTILISRTERFDFENSTAAAAIVDQAEDAAKVALAEADNADAATNDVEAVAAAAAAQAASDGAVDASEQVAELAEETTGVAKTEPQDGSPSVHDTEGLAAIVTPSDGVPGGGTAGDDGVIDSGGDVSDQAAADAAAAAALAVAAAESAELEQQRIQGTTSFYQLLSPNPTAAGMAFLGAYFFAVYLILRAYLRGDLRPRVYNQITARLVTVVVVAYVINVLLQVGEGGARSSGPSHLWSA